MIQELATILLNAGQCRFGPRAPPTDVGDRRILLCLIYGFMRVGGAFVLRIMVSTQRAQAETRTYYW